MSDETINLKQELPMNILVFGSNIKKLYIKSLFNSNKSPKFIDIYELYENSYGWQFLFFSQMAYISFENELDKLITSLIQIWKYKVILMKN